MILKNGCLTIKLNKRIYPYESIIAVNKIIEKKGFSVICSESGNDNIDITITAPKGIDCTEELGYEFCNMLIAEIKNR